MACSEEWWAEEDSEDDCAESERLRKAAAAATIQILNSGGRRGRNRPRPVRSEGGVNGYSHLLNGSAEACLQPSRVGDASMMLNEDMGSSGNHFGSSLVTSTFAAARSAAAHGDDFTAFLRLHTLVTFLHLLLFAF